MRQFFLTTAADELPQIGATVALDRDESHHLFTVLRGGREEDLNLVDGRGHRFTGRSAGRDGRLARVTITAVLRDEAEVQPPRLVLACAVVKGKRFEWALEKAVELGVHAVLPLQCDHGVIEPRSGKRDRWSTIMKAALKQSGRSWLPPIYDMMPVTKALSHLAGGPVFYGALPSDAVAVDPCGSNTGSLNGSSDPPHQLGCFIGPEGGWSSAEGAALATAGAIPVSLGPHVLRSETAAVAGLVLLQSIRSRCLKP